MESLGKKSWNSTKQKIMEKTLKENDELYHVVVENTTAIILRINPQGFIQFANKRGLDFFGYSEDELIGKHAVGTIVPEYDTAGRDLAKMVDEIAKNPDSFHSNENENMRKNGERVWIEWTNSGIYNKNGHLKEFLSVGIDVTYRKKSEEKHKRIIENITEAYVEYDNQWRYVDANSKFEEIFGLKRDEIIGKVVWEVLPQTIGSKQYNEFHKAKKENIPVRFETKSLISGDWFEVNAISHPEGLIVYLHNITERKKMEEELRQSHDHLEEQVENRTVELEEAYQSYKESELKAKERADLLEITHEAIYVRDMDDKITFWNRGAEELYGWTKKEAIGQISHDLTKTEFPIPLEQIKIDLLTKGRWDGELIHERADGTKINVLSRWSLQEDKEEPIGFLEVNVDITDRKKAEEELKQFSEKLSMERKRFYDMLEELPVTISLLTPDQHVKFGNRAYREKFGEHQGRHCYDFIFGFNEPCPWCEAFKPLETGKPHHWDLKTPDGSEIENYNIPFTDFDGSPLILEMNIDVTDKKQAERQLKETINELKHSNQELESFAYITSHDLQEPLRTIASYAQLLERRYKGQLDKDADEFLEFMVSGAKRMKEQIQGLLDYSRVDTKGKEFTDFFADVALKNALNNLKSSIDECNAKITYNSLPLITADENQITRVFQNLIGNAIKFHKEGVRPEIHISSYKTKDEKGQVFSVNDNGIGIEEEYIDNIFEVFKKLHAIGEYEGAGIGLAIVKRIIERHHGRIWVESKYGVGSTFYFTIPIKGQ